MVGVSYKDGYLNNVKHAFVLTTLRNMLRLFNFEQTDEQTALMSGQMVLSFFMIQVFTINFPKTSTNLFIERVMKIGFSIQFIIKIGQWNFDSILGSIMSVFFLMVSYKLLDIYCYYSDKFSSGLLESVKQSLETNQELNQILENLEESIIIISTERVEFLNQRFIFYFGKYLQN